MTTPLPSTWTTSGISRLHGTGILEPDAITTEEPAPLPEPATSAFTYGDNGDVSSYKQVLVAARKSGVRHTDDAGLMALFCADTLQTVAGAVSPRLV